VAQPHTGLLLCPVIVRVRPAHQADHPFAIAGHSDLGTRPDSLHWESALGSARKGPPARPILPGQRYFPHLNDQASQSPGESPRLVPRHCTRACPRSLAEFRCTWIKAPALGLCPRKARPARAGPQAQLATDQHAHLACIAGAARRRLLAPGLSSSRTPRRVGGGVAPPPLTPPDMRVRIRRFVRPFGRAAAGLVPGFSGLGGSSRSWAAIPGGPGSLRPASISC
jgi:hypothetical protein